MTGKISLRGLRNKKLLLAAAVGVGILLLLLPKAETTKTEPKQEEFSLEAEEKRIAAVLSRIEGAGNVSVLLTLDTDTSLEPAFNTERDRQEGTDGTQRSEDRSEVVLQDKEALILRRTYPRYRGALVVVQGNSSALRLQITQAVSALTGLGSDKITVIKGK